MFKTAVVSLIALALLAPAVSGAASPLTSSIMDPVQLAAAAGAGFWGGLACGIAAGAVIVGGAAIISALGGGTTLGLGMAFAFSAGMHAEIICAFLD